MPETCSAVVFVSESDCLNPVTRTTIPCRVEHIASTVVYRQFSCLLALLSDQCAVSWAGPFSLPKASSPSILTNWAMLLEEDQTILAFRLRITVCM